MTMPASQSVPPAHSQAVWVEGLQHLAAAQWTPGVGEAVLHLCRGQAQLLPGLPWRGVDSHLHFERVPHDVPQRLSEAGFLWACRREVPQESHGLCL